MDAGVRFAAVEDAADLAITTALGLALSLHPGGREKAILSVIAGGWAALLQRRQQREVTRQAHDAGVRLAGVEGGPEQRRNIIALVFDPEARSLGDIECGPIADLTTGRQGHVR